DRVQRRYRVDEAESELVVATWPAEVGGRAQKEVLGVDVEAERPLARDGEGSGRSDERRGHRGARHADVRRARERAEDPFSGVERAAAAGGHDVDLLAHLGEG